MSRSHATLEWENGILRLCPVSEEPHPYLPTYSRSITITTMILHFGRMSLIVGTLHVLFASFSLQKHSNPCFLRPEGGSEFTTLVRDEWVELHHGDQISLVPDSLQYSVELETGQREGAGSQAQEERAGSQAQEERAGSQAQQERAGSQAQEERQREDSREQKTTEERVGSEKEEDAGPEREVKVATQTSQEITANQQQTHEQELDGGNGVSSVSAAVEGERRSAGGGTGRRRVLPSWLSGGSGGVATSSKTAVSSRGSSRKTAGSGSRTESCETSGSKTGSEPCGGSSSNKAPVRRKRKLSPSPDDEETSPSAADGQDVSLSVNTHYIPLAAAVTRDSVPQSVSGSPESGGPATPLPPCPYGAACYR